MPPGTNFPYARATAQSMLLCRSGLPETAEKKQEVPLMRRIKLILAVATAVAVMMLAAAPAMASVKHGNHGGRGGTFVVSSSQNSGHNGHNDSDNNIGFISSGNSSFDSVEFEGSNGGRVVK